MKMNEYWKPGAISELTAGATPLNLKVELSKNNQFGKDVLSEERP